MIPRLMTVESEKDSEAGIWYLDNGASNHMTGQKSNFCYLNEQVTGRVRFGDGSTVNIEGKGTITLQYKNGEERLLKDVYNIPTLYNNITSLGQISEEGNKVVINGKMLCIYVMKGSCS